MGEHFIKKCSYCGATISQCRCPGPKATLWGVCAACYRKKADNPDMQPTGYIQDRPNSGDTKDTPND